MIGWLVWTRSSETKPKTSEINWNFTSDSHIFSWLHPAISSNFGWPTPSSKNRSPPGCLETRATVVSLTRWEVTSNATVANQALLAARARALRTQLRLITWDSKSWRCSLWERREIRFDSIYSKQFPLKKNMWFFFWLDDESFFLLGSSACSQK